MPTDQHVGGDPQMPCVPRVHRVASVAAIILASLAAALPPAAGVATAATDAFSIAATPSSVALPADGGTATFSVEVARREGWAGSVTLAVTDGLPADATAVFDPTEVPPEATSASLAIELPAHEDGRTLAVHITGSSGEETAETTVTIVQESAGSSVALVPSRVEMTLGHDGGETSFPILVDGDPATGSAVSLDVSGVPTDGIWRLSSNPVERGRTTHLYLALPRGVAAGSYPITVTTTSGAPETAVTVTLVKQARPDSSLVPPLIDLPTPRFAPGAQVPSAAAGSALPVRVTWSGRDEDGIASYGGRLSTDRGSWASMALPAPTATRLDLTLAPDHIHGFGIRGTDATGRTSAYRDALQVKLVSRQETASAVTYSAGWRSESTTSAYGGTWRRSGQAGARARFTFSGTSVAWIGTRGPDRGRAEVYIDGALSRTVDLYASSRRARTIVFTTRWQEPGSHVLEIRVVGTSGRPRVDVDAFAVLRQVDRSLVGAGDIAGCEGQGDEATAALLEGIDGTVYTTGDNVYPDGSLEAFQACYGPSWGREISRTRPAVGNHEYHVPGAAGYFSYFGARAGPAGKGYYSFDLASWHVVVLNSTCWIVGCSEGSAQLDWLKADLARHPARCTAAIWHYPRWSSGGAGPSPFVDPLVRAIDAAGVDVLLTGHDHHYERFAPQTPDGGVDTVRGIRQFVVGSGGRSHTGLAAPQPNSELRDTSAYGVLQLTLRADGYDWHFVPVEGQWSGDAGSGRCH